MWKMQSFYVYLRALTLWMAAKEVLGEDFIRNVHNCCCRFCSTFNHFSFLIFWTPGECVRLWHLIGFVLHTFLIQMDTDGHRWTLTYGKTCISKPRFELNRGDTRQVVSCTSRWRLRGGGQIPRDIFIFAYTSEYIARQKICFDSLWTWSLKISCLILPFLGLGDMVIMYFQLWYSLLGRRR